MTASDGVDGNSGVLSSAVNSLSSPVVSSLSSPVVSSLSSPVVSSLSNPVVSSLSSPVVNSSSTAVADALLLDAGKKYEGVAVTVTALYAFAEEPKCEVSTVLNNGV